MKRKIYTQLVDWKNQERRKPLVFLQQKAEAHHTSLLSDKVYD